MRSGRADARTLESVGTMRTAAILLLIAAGALGAPVTSLPGFQGKLPFASDAG